MWTSVGNNICIQRKDYDSTCTPVRKSLSGDLSCLCEIKTEKIKITWRSGLLLEISYLCFVAMLYWCTLLASYKSVCDTIRASKGWFVMDLEGNYTVSYEKVLFWKLRCIWNLQNITLFRIRDPSSSFMTSQTSSSGQSLMETYFLKAFWHLKSTQTLIVL